MTIVSNAPGGGGAGGTFSRFEEYWKRYCFYKGWLPDDDLDRVRQYAVVCDHGEGLLSCRQPTAKVLHASATSASVGSSTAPSITNSPSRKATSPPSNIAPPPGGMLNIGTIPPPPPPGVLEPSALDQPHTASSSSVPTSPGSLANDGRTPTSGSQSFYMIRKEHLHSTRAMKPTHSSTKCLEICNHFSNCKKDCPFVHPFSLEHLVQLIPDDGSTSTSKKVYVKCPTGTICVSPTDVQQTAGFLFAMSLMRTGTLQSCHPVLCRHFQNNVCHNGARCLFIHVHHNKLQESITPLVEARTPLTEILGGIVSSPGLTEFCAGLASQGIITIGDLQSMSDQAFEMFAESKSNTKHFWLFLQQFRDFDANYPLPMALMTFPGVEPIDLERLPDSMHTVGDIVELKSKAFYNLRLPLRLMEACEKLRARFDVQQQPVYSSISLRGEHGGDFFARMAVLCTGFRANHAHKSWRKQDATRPIVTSLVTYVNADECKCKILRSGGGNRSFAPGTSPMIGARGERSSSMGPGGSRQGSSGSTQAPSCPDFPIDSWCHCKRSFEIALNYELSTPSGSRCSEQNCLGKLCSMGLPTNCVREVFVHGGSHNGEDPNPLFPCGVCENMLRRISKDVRKVHGGDVMLLMFDAESNPKKLVCLPVCEISHRDGSMFKRFVEEDLKDE